MKKVYLNMVLALTVLVAGFGLNNIKADAATQGLEWTVQYNGGDNFSTLGKDAAKTTIENAMPGDTLQYVVTYANSADSGVTSNFYLNAEVISSLEDNKMDGANTTKNAAGGAYAFSVVYDCKGEKETIYDSETVGGDSVVSAGLNQTKQGNAYVQVGTLAPGESGVVTITIALDGNSQDNSYMEKIAKMNVQFAVQDVNDPGFKDDRIEKSSTVEKHVVYKIPGGKEIIYIDDDTLVPLSGGNPRTGDSILPLVFCGIALLIGLALIMWYFRMTRDEKEEVA